MTVRPDFFLVGAPKCATGSIDAALAAHPRIFLAGKDLHHLAPDLPSTQVPLAPAEYDALFRGAPAGARLGEASVGYLYSTVAARRIHARNPRARILASLRDPVDAVASLHQHCLYYGIEELADLGEALAAQDDRLAGRRLPRRCAHPWMLQYTRVYRVAPQLRRYLETFGRERCHVVLYDDFVADRRATIDAATDFLGVGPLAELPDVQLNRSRQARSRRVSGWLTDPPEPVRRAVRNSLPQRWRRAIADGVLAANTAGARRPSVAPELRAALAAEFADDIAETAALLERDLSQWMPAATLI